MFRFCTGEVEAFVRDYTIGGMSVYEFCRVYRFAPQVETIDT